MTRARGRGAVPGAHAHRRPGRGRTPALAAIAAAVSLLVVAPTPASADPIAVELTAIATCSDAEYTLHWHVYNKTTASVTIVDAQLSGAVTGPVTLAPATLGPYVGTPEHAAADVGPVDGHTIGTVTLTVQLQSGTDTATATAQIPLAGYCAQQALPVPGATVEPTTAAVDGVVTVSGEQCPPQVEPAWPTSTPYSVYVTLAPTGPVPGELRVPDDGIGTNSGLPAIGYGVAPGPGGVIVNVTPAADGHWTAALNLAASVPALTPGTYGVVAVCMTGNNPAALIQYQTPALELVDVIPVPPEPIPATPTYTG